VSSGALKKLVAAIGGLVVASGCLAVPVYGIPCNQKQTDGGTNGCYGDCDTLLPDGGDPKKDSTHYCFTDGGSP
jgi:hypothetical protein